MVMPLSKERDRARKQQERAEQWREEAMAMARAVLTPVLGSTWVETMAPVELHLRFHDYLVSQGRTPEHFGRVWGCLVLAPETATMQGEEWKAFIEVARRNKERYEKTAHYPLAGEHDAV